MRLRLLPLAGLLALVSAAPAAAADPSVRVVRTLTHTFSAAVPAFRACHERPVLVGNGVDRWATVSPTTGAIAVTTAGREGDWDLGIFDAATGRSLGGSTHFHAQEVATAKVRAGQSLIVQACRLNGRSDSISALTRFVSLPAGKPALWQTVRVHVRAGDRGALERLEATGLDVTHSLGRGWIDVVVQAPKGLQVLRRAGFKRLTVLEDDMLARDLANLRRDAQRAATIGRSAMPSGRAEYRRLPDVTADMKKLIATYPTMVRGIVLPEKSLEGRPVEGVEIAKDVAAQDGRPVFLNDGVHHAREWPALEMPLEFAFEAIQSFGKDPVFTDLLTRSRLITVPVQNPDGFNDSREAATPDNVATETVFGVGATGGTQYRRKNCRPAGDAPVVPGTCPMHPGVDTNRNYLPWGGEGAGSDPSSGTYRGSAPFSEPEARNIRDIVLTRPVIGQITNHTNGKMILRPPGQKKLGFSPDEATLKLLGDTMEKDTGYTSMYGWQLYDTHGTARDYLYVATGGYIYTFEHGSLGFHGAYKDDVEGLYYGVGSKKGRGVRGAFIRFWQTIADPASHAVIDGSAAPGTVIRVRKDLKVPTANPIYLVADDTGGNYAGETEGYLVDQKVNMTLVTPPNGQFEFHTYRSTMPFSKVAESFKVTCEDASGKVLDSKDVVLLRGQRAPLALCGGVPPQLPPVVPPGPVKVPSTGGAGPKPGKGKKVRPMRLKVVARRGATKPAQLKKGILTLVATAPKGVVYRSVRAVLSLESSGADPRPYAKTSLKRLKGTVTLRLKATKRLRKGLYTLTVSGKDAKGRLVARRFGVRLG